MCCPYMFVTINAIPYVLGKRSRPMAKKKKKIQMKGENDKDETKNYYISLLTEYHD